MPGALCEEWSADLPGGEGAEALHGGFVWTVLPRHGRRPARFFGRALWRAENRDAARNVALPCWTNVQAYELFDGSFAIGVRHFDAGDDHLVFQDVWHAADGAGVKAALRAHDGAGHGMAWRRAWQQWLGALFGADLAA